MKTRNKLRFLFIMSMIIWFALNIFYLIFVYYRLQVKFSNFINGKEKIMGSLNSYINGLVILFSFAVVFSIVWWLIASLTFKIRRSFEEKTLGYAVAFLIIMLILSCFVQIAQGGVMIENNVMEPLNYKYGFFCIMGINIFCITPETVKDVICMGKWRYAVGGLFAILLGLCFI